MIGVVEAAGQACPAAFVAMMPGGGAEVPNPCYLRWRNGDEIYIIVGIAIATPIADICRCHINTNER